MSSDEHTQRTPADEIDKVRPAQPGRSKPDDLSNDDATEEDPHLGDPDDQ